MNEPQTLPELIRYWRLKRGLTQTSLSHFIGHANEYVNKIETGRMKPLPETILKLAEALGIESDVLFKAGGYYEVKG